MIYSNVTVKIVERNVSFIISNDKIINQCKEIMKITDILFNKFIITEFTAFFILSILIF